MNRRHHINAKQLVCVLASLAWFSGEQHSLADDILAIRKARRRVMPVASVPKQDYQYGARSPSLVVFSLNAIPQFSPYQTDAAIHAARMLADAKSREYSLKQTFQHTKTSENAASGDVESEIETFTNSLGLVDPREVELRTALAEQAKVLATIPIAKLMQPPVQEMTLGHCKISNLAIQIEPSGTWHVSMLAEQNFITSDARNPRNTELGLERNAFHLNIQLRKSASPNAIPLESMIRSDVDTKEPTGMAFVELHVPRFMVQREAPKYISYCSSHPMIAAHYDDINQARFEVYVELDSTLGSGVI